MEWLEILKRIEGGENERTEFKRGPGDWSRVKEAVCAFGNTFGGVVILGVDESGDIVGVKEDPEKFKEQLSNILDTGLSSPVSARTGKHQDPSGWVHWIEVPRQRGFEPLHFRGRVLVRRDRSNVAPSPSELQELYNTFGFVMTEEQAITSASIRDIDLGAFREFLQRYGIDTESEPQPDEEADLLNRGVLTEFDDELVPTLYGLMAFGKDPQRFRHTSNFWIECAAYAGLDRGCDVLQVGEGKGRLDEQVQRAVGWIRGLGRMERYEGLFREDVPLVPERAIREALVNAVAHRDYAILGSKILLEVFDDRITVTSPGTLPNHMTIASVLAGAHPRSRNELMAQFLLVRDMMEKRGRGWLIIRRAMREFNNTEAELSMDADTPFVRVTLRTSPPEE